MVYKLTNNSGSLLVCDLAVKGKSLRLNNKQSKTVKEEEITPYLLNLADKGLILSQQIVEQTKKKSVVKTEKEKEE